MEKIEKLLYPRLPRNLDKRFKLSEQDVKKVFEFYSNGYSVSSIHRFFPFVSYSAIYSLIFPRNRKNQKQYKKKYSPEEYYSIIDRNPSLLKYYSSVSRFRYSLKKQKPTS